MGNASCQPAAPSSPLSCLHLTVSALAEQMAILGGLSGGNKQVQAKWTLVICPRLLEISLVLQCLDYRWLVAELRTCSHSSSGALPVDPNSQEQKQVRVVNVRDVAAEHLQCLLQLIKLFRQSKESIPAHIRKHTMVVFAVMMGGVLSEASELTSDGIAQAKNHPLSSLSKNVLAYLIQSGPQAQTQVQARAPNSSGVVYELHLLCAQYSLDALPLCQYVGRVIQSSATLMQLQSQHRVFAMTAPTEVSALEQRAPHVRATDVDAECQQHSQRNSDKSNDKESSKKRHKENRLANKDQQQGGSGGGDGSAVKRSRIEESHHRQDGTSAATHPVTTPTHQTIKIEDPKQDIEVGAAHEHISRTKAASSIGDHQSTQRVAFLNKGSKGINSSSFLRALQDVPVAAVETNPSGIASTGRCQLEIHTNTLKSEDTSANLSAAISAASRDAKESGQVNPDFPSAVSAAPVNVKVETAHESKGWGLASPQQPLLSSISSSPAVSDHFQSVSRTSGNREVARIAVSKKFGAGF